MTPQRRTIFTARIILKRSAKKHRFTEADVLYEMRNALTVEEDFEASMGYTRSDHTLVIFHDMKCRKKTFELMRRKNND
ncbi:MAG: amidase [Cutibacterium acnes]|nr:amidase [Cutibacterium acnes]